VHVGRPVGIGGNSTDESGINIQLRIRIPVEFSALLNRYLLPLFTYQSKVRQIGSCQEEKN
jgi:hypothetical protein